MQKRKMVKTNCDNCNKEFEKPLSEFKRNNNLGRKNYCSLVCFGKQNISNIPIELRFHPENLIKGRIPDKYTGFREFIRRAKSRKQHIVDVDLEYLINLWEIQQGKCCYTGINLVLPNYKGNDPIYTASLDRIDSNKGYIKGNVQYVSISINMMKGVLTDEQTKILIQLIKNTNFANL